VPGNTFSADGLEFNGHHRPAAVRAGADPVVAEIDFVRAGRG